jgi:hypothetical protein
MFSYAWAPDIDGLYTVIATFEGSNSYYGSSSRSSFYAMPAPEPATSQPTQQPSAADLYFVPATIAIVVLIVIVLAMLAFMMLKKP